MRKLEILAPAGGPEALQAAVFSGADAVYLGGTAFGARANAKNFTREELLEAVRFCHARGVKVHVTVNTLLRDEELSQALDLVGFLCEIAVDAVLVQDMGLFSLLRKRAPGLVLHASTQMSLHTPGGAKLLWELGAGRVVLAREMTLGEIREVASSCPVELESFLHGALCMSVSGQCYLSAALGGRSGNRGLCAQPCRLPFAAPGGTGHDLSLKDLSFVKEIEKLEEAGVYSAKIEGRMKRPEYVAAAVSACRRAADGEAAPPELLDDLEAVFSRSGFTDGYLVGRRGKDMFGVRTKEDVTGATEKVFSSLRGLYQKERQSVPVRLRLTQAGGELRLTAADRQGREASAYVEAAAEGLPALMRERCEAQLRKTGGTPFLVEKVELPEEGVRAGVSQLNALRREALQKLLNLRAERAPIPFAGEEWRPSPSEGEERERELPLRACFRRIEQVCPQAKDCESIVLPLGTELEQLLRLREQGFGRVLLEQPRAFFGAEEEVKRLMESRMKSGFFEFVCGNLGGVELGRQFGKDAILHGAFGLNIFNTAALDFFEELGLSSAEVSFELSGKDLSALGGRLKRGAAVYGRQPLMLVRNCPLANSPKGCLHCKTPGMLTDRMGKKFPVMCTGGGSSRYAELFNSVPLWLGDKQETPGLAAMDFGVLRFTVETAGECGEILAAWKRREPLPRDCTRGLFSKGVL